MHAGPEIGGELVEIVSRQRPAVARVELAALDLRHQVEHLALPAGRAHEVHAIGHTASEVLVDPAGIVELELAAAGVEDADGLRVLQLKQDVGDALPGAGELRDAVAADGSWRAMRCGMRRSEPSSGKK